MDYLRSRVHYSAEMSASFAYISMYEPEYSLTLLGLAGRMPSILFIVLVGNQIDLARAVMLPDGLWTPRRAGSLGRIPGSRFGLLQRMGNVLQLVSWVPSNTV
jgi:hypothetical protein